jgi:hypothetical protein
MGLDKRRNDDKCVDAPKTEHLTFNVLIIRFLDTLSEFFGNSFDKSMEGEKRLE